MRTPAHAYGTIFILASCCLLGCGESERSNGGAADDAGAADAAGPSDGGNPFAEAAQLDCTELALTWYEALNRFAASRGCADDADCVLVSTDVTCTADGSPTIQFTSCGTTVARADQEGFERQREALESQLCASDAQPCNAASICPAELTARCVEDVCTVQ